MALDEQEHWKCQHQNQMQQQGGQVSQSGGFMTSNNGPNKMPQSRSPQTSNPEKGWTWEEQADMAAAAEQQRAVSPVKEPVEDFG